MNYLMYLHKNLYRWFVLQSTTFPVTIFYPEKYSFILLCHLYTLPWSNIYIKSLSIRAKVYSFLDKTLTVHVWHRFFLMFICQELWCFIKLVAEVLKSKPMTYALFIPGNAYVWLLFRVLWNFNEGDQLYECLVPNAVCSQMILALTCHL